MIKKIMIIGSGIVSLCFIGYLMNIHLYLMGLDPFLSQLNIQSDYTFQKGAQFHEYKKFGTGDQNLILIPGLGMDWEVFKSFVEANKEKYTMYAVNLFGFGNEAMPKKPEEFNDYYKTVYIDYNVEAIRNLIIEEQLHNVTPVGYFMGASQVVYKLSIKYPELISNSIVIAGEVRRFPFNEKRRIDWINDLAFNFFNHVGREKWNQGKFQMDDWSDNEEIALKYFNIDNDDALPILIQYTIESNAFDLTYTIDSLRIPLLAITPDFQTRNDSREIDRLLTSSFVKEWEDLAAEKDFVTTKKIRGSRLAILEDKPIEVGLMIDSFVSMISEN